MGESFTVVMAECVGKVDSAMDQSFEQAWRGRAVFLASKLRDAHASVQALATTFDKGRARSALRRYRSIREQIVSLSDQVRALRSEQPPNGRMDTATAEGSTLAIRGSDAATDALGLMLDAMAALHATDDDSTVDVLVGACNDAEHAYEDSVAIVQATSRAHGPAITTLTRAFDTDGEVALRERVWRKWSAVRAINDRVEPLGALKP